MVALTFRHQMSGSAFIRLTDIILRLFELTARSGSWTIALLFTMCCTTHGQLNLVLDQGIEPCTASL